MSSKNLSKNILFNIFSSIKSVGIIFIALALFIMLFNLAIPTGKIWDLISKNTSNIDGNYNFLQFCLFGDKELEVKQNADVQCSIGSNGSIKIQERTTISGRILSTNGDIALKENTRVHGDVSADGRIVLEKSSIVQGDILSGDDVVLKEKVSVEGNITAAGRVKLQNGAVVTGTIQEYANIPARFVHFQSGS